MGVGVGPANIYECSDPGGELFGFYQRFRKDDKLGHSNSLAVLAIPYTVEGALQAFSALALIVRILEGIVPISQRLAE